jgi:hypothetical protein
LHGIPHLSDCELTYIVISNKKHEESEMNSDHSSGDESDYIEDIEWDEGKEKGQNHGADMKSSDDDSHRLVLALNCDYEYTC